MNIRIETFAATGKYWGPYQLKANPLAILRLSLGTAAFISTCLVIPDVFALIPASSNIITLFCKACGLWSYACVLWASGFLCLLHLVRISGGCLLHLDSESIKLGRMSKKIPWTSIVAITVAQRKMFSRLFFVPSYQMTVHFVKPDGRRATRQIASFLFSENEFYSLFYHIAEQSLGVQPQSINAFVFKDVTLTGLKKMAEGQRWKSAALTALICFGLVSFLGRNAVKNYSFNMGNREFRAARYDRAAGYFSTACAIDFTFAPAFDRLARCEFRQGDLDAAESDWLTALRWKPDYVESKLGLSAIYMLRGRLDEADRLINSASRLAPFDEAAYLNRAQLDMLTGKTGLAVKRLEQFIRQKKGREQAVCLLARCYIRQGRLAEAAAILKAEPALLNNSYTKPFCTMVLSELNMAENNTVRAEELLRSIRFQANHQPDLLIDMARLDISQHKFVSASRKLDAAATINPDEPWLNLVRAELAREQKGADQELFLQKALAFKYADPALMAACAQLLEKRGQGRQARELAGKALALDPDNLNAAGILKSAGGHS